MSELIIIDNAARIFTIIAIIIALIISLKLISKYFELKDKIFITIGLAWFLMFSPWWDIALLFLIRNLGGISVVKPESTIIASITDVQVAIAIILWMYSFCQLLYKRFTIRVTLIYIILGIFYFITTFYHAFGPQEGDFSFFSNTYILIYQIFMISSTLITGLLIMRKSRQSEIKKVRLKGIFLLLSFILFTLSVFIDVFLDIQIDIYGMNLANATMLLFIRVILTISSICYYFGFFLPERIFNFWLKKNEH